MNNFILKLKAEFGVDFRLKKVDSFKGGHSPLRKHGYRVTGSSFCSPLQLQSCSAASEGNYSAETDII